MSDKTALLNLIHLVKKKAQEVLSENQASSTKIYQLAQENFSLLEKRCKAIERNQRYLTKKMENVIQCIEKYSYLSELFSYKWEKKVNELEDSLLHIMHNIKKNQFLYSHYPDDWAKTYQSLKEGIKDENSYMDKKIEGEND